MNNFKLIKETNSKELGATIYEYEHTETKARHIHINSNTLINGENSCLIAFNTPPENSHGTPHVLEHLVLNGSAKYNVKNVFHNMTNRSSAEYMNAMTASDITMYPFSTQNKKDYENLLNVYLDSVFHSNLSEIDYLQEGWRYDFDKNNNLEYKGIVFNEMRGALSSKTREILYNFNSTVYKDTIYKNYSGGEPSEIVKLTYEEIKNFYEKYYHPSNATFFTYGYIDINKTQEIISDSLSKFKYKEIKIDPSSYIESNEYINSSKEFQISHYSKEEDQNALILSWFTHDSKNRLDSLRLNLFHSIMLEQDSQLILNCEKENILLSDFVGLFDSNRQTLFFLGVDNIPENDLNKTKSILLKSLKDFTEQNFDKKRLHNYLDKIEFSLKNKSKNNYSVNLLTQLSSVITESNFNIEDILNIDQMIKTVREEIDSGNLLKNVYNQYLTEDKLKTTVSFADTQKYVNNAVKEKEILKNVNERLTDKERLDIVYKNKQILDYQLKTYDYSVLPSLELKDIELNSSDLLNIKSNIKDGIIFYQTEEEICELKIFLDVPDTSFNMNDNLIRYLHQLFLLEYVSTDKLNEVDFSIKKESNIFNYKFNELNFKNKKTGQVNVLDIISGKNLENKTENLITTLFESIYDIKFDNIEKLKFCLNELLNNLNDENSLGQKLINKILLKDFDPENSLSMTGDNLYHQLNKKEYIKNLLNDPINLEILMENIRDYHKDLLNSKIIIKYIGNEKDIEIINKEITKRNIQLKNGNNVKEIFNNIDEKTLAYKFNKVNEEIKNKEFINERILLSGPTNVGYNYRVYRVDNKDLKTNANLLIAANILTSKYLIPGIREKNGAYGANSGFYTDKGIFILSSYRDPEFENTYKEFENSLKNFKQENIDKEDIKNAIISVVGNLYNLKNFSLKVNDSLMKEVKETKEYEENLVKEILNVTNESLVEAISKLQSYKDYSYHSDSHDINPEWNILKVNQVSTVRSKNKI